MSATIDNTSAQEIPREPLAAKFDERLGSAGMRLFILTEAILFVMLFFSYFYIIGTGGGRISVEPPGLHFALPMLGALLASSAVLYWGEAQVKRRNHGWGRLLLLATILIGAAFLVLRFFEYRERIKTMSPGSDAYGSIFYTITGFHTAYLISGLLMLFYVLILPRFEPADRPPHRPYHNAALYWHFVGLVWIFMVAIMYVAPKFGWL
jgi:cytochrome c oxidase subunit III